MAWYDNADTRGYNNMLGTQAWPEYNPNLFRNTGIGRFDVRNMIRPSNLSQDLGASTYQAPVAPQLNTLGPNWQNELAGYGSTMDRGNINNTWLSNLKGNVSNVKDTLGNWKDTIAGGVTSLLDNTVLGRIAAARDATNPRAGNYNPNLRSQIDFLESKGMHGVMDASGLNKITQGALQGKNLQSMFGTNDLIGMYNDQVARHDKTIEGFADQWGNLKEEDEDAYNAKLQVHLDRKKQAELERAQVIANQQKLSDERAQKEKDFVTQNLGVTAADVGSTTTQGGGGGIASSGMTGAQAAGMGGGSRQATSAGSTKSGRTDSGWGWKEGGRIGYNRGRVVNPGGYQGDEFEDENTLEFMQDQGIPYGEMAETSPFEMRIQELMDTGMSWQEAYQIASEEFATAERPEESFSEEGIASIV